MDGGFPDAMILMRDHLLLQKHGFGLYNDMTDIHREPRVRLDWISNGGEYDQTGEKNAMVSMKD